MFAILLAPQDCQHNEHGGFNGDCHTQASDHSVTDWLSAAEKRGAGGRAGAGSRDGVSGNKLPRWMAGRRSRESRSWRFDVSNIVMGEGHWGGVEACRKREEEEEQSGFHCDVVLV